MIALLKRDLRLALRSGGGAGSALLFYMVVVIAMPFVVGPNTQLLSTIGAAVLWIGALLAALLGLERLFQMDREDGSLSCFLGWSGSGGKADYARRQGRLRQEARSTTPGGEGPG